MRPPGSGDYADILYPKTSADIVVSTNGTVQADITALQSGKSDVGHTHTKANITDFPALGTASALNTGTAQGNIPVLETGGKLNASILPAIAITDTFPVASQSAMLALTAEVGDVCVRTDENKSYILKTAGASTLANWEWLRTPTEMTKAGVEAVLTGVISSHSHASGTPTAHATTHITGGSDVIPNFTSVANGLVPLSGGGTTKYLRADGTWVVPPDTNTVYTHPTTDGSLHVPATGTVNNGKVLKAGATAGSMAWGTLATSELNNDAGFITKSLTIGAVQPVDNTLWFKELA